MCKLVKLMLVLITVAVALPACKDSEDTPIVNKKPEWHAPTDVWVTEAPKWVAYLLQEDSRPDWVVDLSGDDAVPEWEGPDNHKYPSSMTAVLVVPDFLKPYESDDDMIAAFIGGECRGIGDIEVVDGAMYYFINIKGNDTDSGKVIFKYYNSRLHTMYTADNGVQFILDSVYGTVASPQEVDFKNTGKYPLQMTLEVSVDQNLGGFTATEGDMVAVFAGDECRASANVKHGATTVSLDILGREDGEALSLYYYTSQYKGIMRHNEQLVFSQGKVIRLVPQLRAMNSVDVYLQVDSELRSNVNGVSQMAVFVGEECRSYSVSMGQGRFHSMVLADPDDDVTVRYYIDGLRVIFESAPMKMRELMSTDENNYYTVPLVTDGRYPFMMSLVLALPPDLKSNEGVGDILAAFIGDECRGLAQARNADGEVIYQMDVVRQLGESQKVTVKYYCAKTGRIYQSMPFVFEPDVVMGSELYPEYLYFNEVEG